MQKQQALSKKVVRTLLAMSFVYSGGMFVADEARAAAPTFATPVKTIDCDGGFTNNDPIIITAADVASSSADVGLKLDMKQQSEKDYKFTGAVNIDAGTSGTALYVDYHFSNATDSNCGYISLDGDVTLKAALGNYAIYLSDVGCNYSKKGSLTINAAGNKTVQIEGNIRNNTHGPISLNLTNAQSYWAGDLDGQNRANNINLKLSNSAVWYPVLDTRQSYLYIDSDGGIIDIYHQKPGEARADTSSRTFEIKNIQDSNGHKITNTTFRIGSDVMGVNNSGTGTADKIVLTGAGSVSGKNEHYIQIVADPSIKSSNASMDLAAKKIVVAQVDGTYLTKDNTSFAGKKYEGAEVDAGLTLADVTPELEYDSSVDSNKGGWIIKNVTAENFRAASVDGEKGSALTLAEIGASTALNVASAWRADNNDLLRRMGDLRASSDDAGVWVRMYGGKNEVVQGQRSDLSYKAVQGGYDFQNNLKNGRLFTGFTVSHLDGDVSGSRTDGDINSTMFGVYSSYIGDKGHFADLIVKYGRINSDFSTIKGTNRYGADYGSNGFSITTEYGYRQNLKNNFYIEPQAELTYSRIGGSNYTMSLNDKDGAKVSNDAFNSLIGRIGFTAGRQQEQSNVYAKLSLAREFKGEVATSASYGEVTRSYAGGGSDTWLEYGIGFNAKMSKGTNLYGEIEKTTGSVIRTKWRANMGLRYSF